MNNPDDTQNISAEPAEPIITINGMHKWFGDFHVLKNINLEVRRGERIVICGPSGSGKSTLIRCINRLEEHQQGTITVDGTELRVSVLETTSPATILDRKDSLMASMVEVAKEDGADQVLLFVIDILKEEATLLIPNDLVKTMAEKSFGVTVTGDTVVLPGVMSRKKQIIPSLKV